jgi:hypothetical protein
VLLCWLLRRLEEHSLPSSLVLPLQQDYAALCDEVGARGDFDRLTGVILAASTAAVHDMGLQEMMVSACALRFSGLPWRRACTPPRALLFDVAVNNAWECFCSVHDHSKKEENW